MVTLPSNGNHDTGMNCTAKASYSEIRVNQQALLLEVGMHPPFNDYHYI